MCGLVVVLGDEGCGGFEVMCYGGFVNGSYAAWECGALWLAAGLLSSGGVYKKEADPDRVSSSAFTLW